MGGEDTGVNDEDGGSGSSTAVVDVGGRILVLVRDTAKSPSSTSLGSQSRGVDLLVLLNVCNLKLLAELHHLNPENLHLEMRRSRQEWQHQL